MATKYIINSTETAVSDMLEGVVALKKDLKLYPKQKVVVSKFIKNQRVHLISGGGSGHEPFAAGYVGEGMLTAAIAGSIFASPPSGNIYHAIDTICQGKETSVLAIVANYTGDVLNFGIACEKSKNNGHNVASIVVGEDCALLKSGRVTKAGRRGMCGIIFVIKIAGAMAVSGEQLEVIVEESNQIIKNISTFGVCLECCSIPGSTPMFKLKNDEIDLGLGIHGEAGMSRIQIKSSKEIVEILLGRILNSLEPIKNDEQISILVNNLGTMSQLEMGIIKNDIVKYFDFYNKLNKINVVIKSIYSGHFMTSLDMKGFQICILKIENSKWINWLNQTTSAPGWSNIIFDNDNDYTEVSKEVDNVKSLEEIFEENKSKWTSSVQIPPDQQNIVRKCLKNIIDNISLFEEKLNQLDTICGDGDCGTTLCVLVKGINELERVAPEDYIKYPIVMFNLLERWVDFKMGGTSGALYSLMFIGATKWILENKTIGLTFWSQIFIAGVDGLMKYSQARKGDRTMLDVLIPCKEALDNCIGMSMKVIVRVLEDTAREACESTKTMIPKAGRAGNVDPELIKNVDAGAYGAYTWITSITEVLKKEYQ